MSRFQVHTVTGWPISEVPCKSTRNPQTSYVVLDSAVCFHVVQEFRPVGGWNDRGGMRKARAEALADRLNEAYP